MTCLAPDDESMNPAAVLAALASAVLFGVSTPAAKALLGMVDPVVLAGLFYCGAAMVSWSGTPTFESLAGPLAIVAACIAWGIDNNLTRKVSLADPLEIVQLKGLIAGPVNLLLGLWAGGSLPGPVGILLAALIGFVCYGLSLALFVVALRHLGAARSGAYFSTAPFIGAATAVVALQQPLSVQLVAA